MLIEIDIFREIRNNWHGNGGEMSLHELGHRYNIDKNTIYCILALPEQSASTKKKAFNVHSYHGPEAEIED